MKEFYLKNKNDEIYFFFRNKNKNSVSYLEWKRMIDKKDDLGDPYESLEKFLKFIEFEKKETSNFDSVEITEWKGLKYKLVKITFENYDFSSMFTSRNCAFLKNSCYLVKEK